MKSRAQRKLAAFRRGDRKYREHTEDRVFVQLNIVTRDLGGEHTMTVEQASKYNAALRRDGSDLRWFSP